jgi:UDP-N-acetylglucosamine 2-epimerase (non-hydrolysing)
MRVLTILGTRPEIIRLSLVIERLDELCDHRLVHTGQNYEHSLSGVFFSELGVRDPDLELGLRGEGFGERVGQIIAASERVLREERPDRLLVLGDTDSGLAAYAAKRLGIPVFHMEAGNRCFDDRVPEEVNRRVIDHSSDVLLPYTERSRANLLREGIASERIFVTGNPIKEVIDRHAGQIEASSALADLGVEPGGFLLLTMHRQETVDDAERLRSAVAAVIEVATAWELPVVVSMHPRTRSRLERFGIELSGEGIHVCEPFGFHDFVRLERSARCVLTDSGTVQEECCIFGVPAVTIRDVTERPETLECGSNVLGGTRPESIARALRTALSVPPRWTPPQEYLATEVSSTVARIVLGHHDVFAERTGPRTPEPQGSVHVE